MKKDPLRRQVLQVKGCFAGSKAENLLEQGDMILAINKKLVTCFRDIEDACQLLDHSRNDDGKLDLTIVRRVSKNLFDISFTSFNFTYLINKNSLFSLSVYVMQVQEFRHPLDFSFVAHGFSGK